MSNPPACDPAPKTPKANGVVAFVTLLILAFPFAAMAAGTGAFLGMSVAAAGWGPACLGVGAAAGAGIGALLVGAWAIAFIACAKEPKLNPTVHAEKVKAFIEDMKLRGVSPNTSAPILFRLLWLMGLQVPPPFFLGAWVNVLWQVGVLGALIASAGAVLWWERPNAPLWTMWLTVLIFHLGVVGIGAYYALATPSTAHKYQLPSWDRYTPPLGPEPPDPSQPEGSRTNG